MVQRIRRTQQGIALLAVALLVMLGMLALVAASVSGEELRLRRERTTIAALAQAKSALIGRAVGLAITDIGAARPGDLPCPDLDDDGTAESACGNSSGTTGQALRLGRLPWRTLGLPDLRDGYGERLWYAVSNNYKNNTRRTPLNSGTPGTITLRDASGTIINDGANPAFPAVASGLVALLLAPGPAIQRQGAGAVQDRSCTGGSCDSSGRCTSVPASLTPKCNPLNYLDVAPGEDNASFVDSSADGFIGGDVFTAPPAREVLVNDRVATIGYDEMMPLIEARVVAEVRNCLSEYAADPLRGNGRYPWAAPLNPLLPPAYLDVAGARFGRVPDTPFLSTQLSMSGTQTSSAQWPATVICDIASNSGWWSQNNWKEIVFYGVADAYKPALIPGPACGLCITVNSPAAIGNRQFVVVAAGREVGAQSRTTNVARGTIGNYLEGQNATPGDDLFEKGPPSAAFNDRLVFFP